MKKKILLFQLLLFSFIILVLFYLLTIDRNPNEIPSAMIGKKVPAFKAKQITNQKYFESPNQFSSEIVLVNFFATWCKPCLEEHKYIQLFSDKNKVKIIGINYKDSSVKTLKWLKKLGNPYNIVAEDKNGRIAIDWGVYGIPETFVVNKNQIITYRHVGPINKKIYKKISTLINEIDK